MNKVILMGRMVADPELRFTTGNIAVCKFRIAVDRSFQKEGEERAADFFNVTAWRQTGEFISKYFRKGARILVEGWMMNNNYEDKDGVKHYGMEMQAERAYFTESKKADDGGQAPASPTSPNSAPQPAANKDNVPPPPWDNSSKDLPKGNETTVQPEKMPWEK